MEDVAVGSAVAGSKVVGSKVVGSGASASAGAALGPPPVDGRTARAQRTRDAIVEACVTLVQAGDIRPTAPRIAEAAGVSVRSVFQHFDDLETLFTLVAKRSVSGLDDLVPRIDPHLAFDDRVERFVRQRAQLLEAVTPLRRAAAVHAPFSPAISASVSDGHRFLRAQLSEVFAEELGALPASEVDQTLDMLDVATTWSTWELLRTLEQRRVSEAVAVVVALVRAALGARLAAIRPQAPPVGRLR